MDKVLEQRLSNVKFDKLDGKRYISSSDLAYLLGISRNMLSLHKKGGKYADLLRPEFVFGRDHYYSRERVIEIYAKFSKGL